MNMPARNRRTKKPVVFGTGLIALDLVISSDRRVPPKFYAGGTCGNVLTILAYLGWTAYPVARLNGDLAAKRLRRDLRRWGVSLRFSSLRPPAKTPIIVEWISVNQRGESCHRFSFTCPGCDSWFPSYKPVHAAAVVPVTAKLSSPNVFFFDRASRGALVLAQHCVERGGLVVFEPSGIGDPQLFRQAIDICHVLKYSNERLTDLSAVHDTSQPLLEIETLGGGGLRYRSRLPHARSGGWRHVSGYPVERAADAAGAGDWLTAGVLYQLASQGASGLLAVTKDRLLAGLKFAQAAAAWNCRFEGPRGGMYRVDRSAFLDEVNKMLDGTSSIPAQPSAGDKLLRRAARLLCPACKEKNRGGGGARRLSKQRASRRPERPAQLSK